MTSTQAPDGTAVAAELGGHRARRRPFSWTRLFRAAVPHLLCSRSPSSSRPSSAIPLYKLVTLSFQQYGLPELIQKQGTWIGFDNYASVLRTRSSGGALRTVIFTAANVALTMVLGTLIGLLLASVSTWVRVLLSTGLVLVWAMPAVVAVQVFYWMTNFESGILNYALAQVGLVGEQHDWYETTFSKLAMVTVLIGAGRDPVRGDNGLRRAGASAP